MAAGPGGTSEDGPPGGVGGEEDRVRIVILGDGAVGKTTLIETIFFKGESQPNTYDQYDSKILLSGRECPVSIFDTIGHDEVFIDPLRLQIFGDAHMFVLVFSAISPPSFKSVKDKWVPLIHKHAAGTNLPLLLLSTKIDLRTDESILQRLADRNMVPITTAQGRALADEIGAIYAEVSLFNSPETTILEKLSQLQSGGGSKKPKPKKPNKCTIA